ncbi:MAG TPA: Npt1/Npt2 family nucleotide transporter [Vicinamibacterales bacterium]|nr:Npt1/Npt2 family nucleotide transporter [Vicinamibacterales bacterium]
MLPRLRRFLDVRPGEGLPVLLTFFYIATVVAAFLLAKPLRNGLFLGQHGPYALVYVYAAAPLALSLFVPAYTRVVARFGSRTVTIGTLLFFATNVVLFWYLFRFARFALLPGLFYVWVNCFAVIAPVQAWSFANSLFDTRQAKRLFGLIGAGASAGAITGGLLARFLTRPVGGAVNMMLVLAALIAGAAVIVSIANVRIPRRGAARVGRPVSSPFRETLRQIAATPYLRLIAVLVFLVAVATQWLAFQLSVVADERFGGDADALTRFFGTFNFTLGSVSFLLQVLVTGPALRRFGLGFTILVLPLSLAFGSSLILLFPVFWAVLLTNATDQGFRFSLDKATYELLYLPIAPAQRATFKSAIDIVVNRFSDALGGLMLGLATRGFLMFPGLGLGVRGTAAVNLALIGAWTVVAWRLRREYVRTIHDSIHRHRIDTERSSASVIEKSAAEALRAKLEGEDAGEVRYALSLLEVQQTKSWQPALRHLLAHPDADIRRRALRLLSADRDRAIADEAVRLLRDPDLGVRTEALLYLSREMGIDPLTRIQELGDFEDVSIRAGMAAFLASPGPSQNLEAAHALIEAMIAAGGETGIRDRLEAARVVGIVPEAFAGLLPTVIADENDEVALAGIRAARALGSDELVTPLVSALGRPALTDEAAGALARLGNGVVPELARMLGSPAVDAETRRELPGVLVRIGSPAAEQVLVDSLLHADVTLRHRVVASLNKLRVLHPEVALETSAVELLLAAEIAGHYRSYQVLGPLQDQLKDDDPVVMAMRASMEQELERIFRLMALLYPQEGLHDAYVGVRAANPIVRANALEFLENVLKPELRHVLVPILDSQVPIAERIALADRLIGARVETPEEAVGTLLASEDAWLRSCAVYAVGTLQLHALEAEIRAFESSEDPVLQASVRTARRRLAGEMVPAGPQEPAPADMDMGVGVG